MSIWIWIQTPNFYLDSDPDPKGVNIKETYTNKFSTKFFKTTLKHH